MTVKVMIESDEGFKSFESVELNPQATGLWRLLWNVPPMLYPIIDLCDRCMPLEFSGITVGSKNKGTDWSSMSYSLSLTKGVFDGRDWLGDSIPGYYTVSGLGSATIESRFPQLRREAVPGVTYPASVSAGMCEKGKSWILVPFRYIPKKDVVRNSGEVYLKTLWASLNCGMMEATFNPNGNPQFVQAQIQDFKIRLFDFACTVISMHYDIKTFLIED